MSPLNRDTLEQRKHNVSYAYSGNAAETINETKTGKTAEKRSHSPNNKFRFSQRFGIVFAVRQPRLKTLPESICFEKRVEI